MRGEGGTRLAGLNAKITENTIKEVIETAIGSIGKVRIIKVLAEENLLVTVYLLHKKTRLKREDIKSNLRDLVEIGWVKEDRFANSLYSINRKNENVNRFVEFLQDTGYIGQY